MYILSILIFIITSGIHLIASYKQNIKLRAISKVLILPSLILFYISKANTVEIYFVIALIFSWLGDLLLIPKGKLFFTFGGIAFLISHLFFIIAYTSHIESFKECILIFAIVEIIYISITLVVFKHLTKYLPKFLIVPMFIYLIANASMNSFAFTLMYSVKDIYTLIIYLGALSFFVSDTNLFFVRFKVEEQKQNHFVVMFTYIIAEFLIVLGYLHF